MLLRTRRNVVSLAVFAICGVVLACVVWCRSLPTMSISIAVTTGTPLVSPIMLLPESIGTQSTEQVRIHLQKFVVGKACFDSLLSGSSDLATVAETPLVHAAVRGVEFEVVATLARSSNHVRVVGRADQGILRPSDLIGKKVGVPVGTNNEYYLQLFLKHNDIAASNVSIVNFTPSEMLNALISGVIDAAVLWNPYLSRAKAELKDSLTVFPAGDYYRVHYFLVSRPGFAKRYPVEMAAFRAGFRIDVSRLRMQIAELAAALDVSVDILSDVLADYEFPGEVELSDYEACIAQVPWSCTNNFGKEDLARSNLEKAFGPIVGRLK